MLLRSAAAAGRKTLGRVAGDSAAGAPAVNTNITTAGFHRCPHPKNSAFLEQLMAVPGSLQGSHYSWALAWVGLSLRAFRQQVCILPRIYNQWFGDKWELRPEASIYFPMRAGCESVDETWIFKCRLMNFLEANNYDFLDHMKISVAKRGLTKKIFCYDT